MLHNVFTKIIDSDKYISDLEHCHQVFFRISLSVVNEEIGYCYLLNIKAQTSTKQLEIRT